MGLFSFLKKKSSGFIRPTNIAPAPPPPGEKRALGNVIRPRRLNGATEQRAFAEAAGDSRLTGSWDAWPTTADAYIFQFWYRLVARSRDMSEKSDHARKFLQMCVDNIAGPNGFTLMSQIKDPSGTADKVARDAVENAWAEFSKKGTFEITRSMSRADVERLIVKTVARDGECLAIKRRSKNLPFGFAIQLIDPVMLDPTYFATLSNGNHVKHGIEFNADEQPVAYHLRKQEERQMGYILGTGNSYQRIDAADVVHVFVVEMIGQKRGLPWMRTALTRIKHLSAFEDAAIVNARVSAAKMGFFKDTDGDPDDSEDLPMDAEPGTFENIGNREFVSWDPKFPDDAFEPFSRACLRSISVGLGVSYNNLAGDLTSVNFSSIRQGALDEREVWKGLQRFFISSWCEPVYPEWLQMAMLMEKITVPNKSGGTSPLPFSKIEKYMAVLFVGRRWAWIDPKSEVDANAAAVGQKFTSRSEVIRGMGGDPDEVWAECAYEEETFKKLGIIPDKMPGSPQPSALEDKKQKA